MLLVDMKKPQFGERQYEIAANIELARGAASPFVPTQNVEYYVGFDAAHDPEKAHAIWRILSVQAPRRVFLSPDLWPRLPLHHHDHILGRYASLFVQYKRAVYQDHRRAKHLQRIGAPYFQVSVERQQQRRLIDLESRVRSRAVVRYAAPAFWSLNDFGQYDSRREVLRHSAFVSPAQVGSHRRWMYCDQRGRAFFNTEFEESDGESWENVIRVLSARGRRESLRDHVRALSASLVGELPPLAERGEVQWVERLRRYGRFGDEDVQMLVEISRVSLVAADFGISWVILLLPDAPMNSLSDESRRPWHWFPWWHRP